MFGKTNVKDYYGLLRELREETKAIMEIIKRFEAYAKKAELGKAEKEQAGKFLEKLHEARKKGKNLFGL